MNKKLLRNILIFFLITISGTFSYIFINNKNISGFTSFDQVPVIEPDYSGTVIPPNIAPLNFTIKETGRKFSVRIHSENGKSINISCKNGNVKIPINKWKKLLNQNKGNELFFDIYSKNEANKRIKYKTFKNRIADEEIDNYLVYRLIHPGFILWGKMGIYQRNIQNFDESPVMLNRTTEDNCMNCHSFCKNNGEVMLFHLRAQFGGTMIIRDGDIKKVNTKTPETLSAGVYPSWHPNGSLVAFSVNKIQQYFHVNPEKRIEVLDLASDIILYDVGKNIVSTSKSISTKKSFETFPTWSPDGNFLYFCSAPAKPPNEFDQIKYDLLRIAFNQETHEFGEIDTIIFSNKTGLSVSFPRISPDGQYILFCMSEYGNFTIWHPESDLYIFDLANKKIMKPDINSMETESYHTWSSNGRWIVFSSRRIDGLFTRPYFAYFGKNGKTGKPFLLPQKNPDFYQIFLKSYNIPELIKNPVAASTWHLNKIAHKEAINAKFQ